MKYGVTNFRRLKKIDPIELKRITILVGKNSSGKSSYLRSLLLLKQSINTKTSSPILWYGNLVDFGSYRDTVFLHDINKSISFKFEMDNNHKEIIPYWNPIYTHLKNLDILKNLTYEVEIKKIKDETRVIKLAILIVSPKINYEMQFDNLGYLNNLKINNKNRTIEVEKNFIITPDSIYPELNLSADLAKSISKSSNLKLFYLNNRIPSSILESFKATLLEYMKKAGIEQASDKTDELIYYFVQNGLTLLNDGLEVNARSANVNNFMKLINSSRTLKNEFINKLHLLVLPQLIGICKMHLHSYLSRASYLGPARARSERYYRYQELAVTEIDSDGKNLPMFLKSLTSQQKKNFSDWIENKFGYGIKISESEGHISINLITNKSEANIVDTGYGFSQILPILAQVWWAKEISKKESRNQFPRLIMIEQPELHLHPAHQALLADAFSEEAMSNKLSFLIETHSEAIINRLGMLIGEGRLNSEYVNIIIFEDDPKNTNVTLTKIANYKNDGTLNNWPYGFFQSLEF